MDESKANLIVVAAVGALLLLTAAVVLLATLHAPATPSATSALDADDLAAPSVPAAAAVAGAATVTPTPDATAAAPVAVAASAAAAPVAPAAISSPPRTPSLPDLMAHIPSDSSQIIIATGAHLGSRDGTVYVFDKDGGTWAEKFRTTTRMGTNGLVEGLTRTQGSRTTPTGIWRLGAFAFGKAASAPSGATMPWRQIQPTSYWSAQNDPTYNTWVDHAVSGEHLISSADLQYEFALSSGFDQPPNERVYGRGTAIFLHVEDPPSYHEGYTAGCFGVPRASMIAILKLVDPSRHPVFASGTLDRQTPTSIYAY